MGRRRPVAPRVRLHRPVERPCLVHCDKGQSRSPTLALAYLGRRTDAIPDDWFPAVEAFQVLYPGYAPNGIYFWLAANWQHL